MYIYIYEYRDWCRLCGLGLINPIAQNVISCAVAGLQIGTQSS